MRRNVVLLVVVAVLTWGNAVGQNEPAAVKVSKDKVKISGKLYYIHTVKEGETLYTIAKAYQVAQAAIIESNPETYKGVKVGNIIKIPVVQELKNPNPNRNKYHVVKKGETLYAISRTYNVPVDVLIKVNLLEDLKVRENQQIFIPEDTVATPSVSKLPLVEAPAKPTATPAGPLTHEVLPKETIFSIAKKYGVSREALESANPTIKDEGLKIGQMLTIPAAAKAAEAAHEAAPEAKPTTHIKDCPPYLYHPETPFNVVLMLPFSISEPKGEATQPSESQRKYEDIMQYYQGTLLALDSLKRSGVSVNLTVVDTKNDQAPDALAAALKNPALKQAQLIIGPVYPSAIPAVAKFASEQGIPMVTPLASVPQVVGQYPSLIQVATDAATIQAMSLEYALQQVDGQTMLVYSSDGSDAKLVKEFKASLKTKLPEITYRQGGHAQAQREALKEKLMEGKKNRFIVLSNNEVFVLDFLQNLSIAAKGTDVEVLGTPRWLKFTSIDMQYIHGSNVEIFVPNYVDYKEEGARSFTQAFRNYYKTEPNNYAFRGFDVAFFFIDAMRLHGPGFVRCLPSISRSNIHTPFHFKQVGEQGGFINTEAVLIKHTEGFRVVKVH